jgi:hypothetical protein
MRNDYTKWPLGRKVFEGIPDIHPVTGEDVGQVIGEIERCPHCGLNGLAKLTEQKWTYTHEEIAMQNADGQFVMRWNSCPDPPFPSEEHR